MVSRSVIGTPAAVVPPDPKLVRRSLRTMPFSVRMSTPLLPSPGNGPAVSSGTALLALALALPPALVPVPALVLVVVPVPAADDRPRPHAASTSTAPPPNGDRN